MALACEPRLLVADEPTTALDVTVQAQMLDLLHEPRRRGARAVTAVEGAPLTLHAGETHDLAVVRQVSDRVAVMRAGRIVEQGTVAEVYGAPRDPYTRQLLAAVPSLDPVRATERRELRRAGRQELAVA